MEYTKGEWKQFHSRSQEVWSYRDGYRPKYVCTVEMNNDEFDANAHLIAAAPLMYEALKAVKYGVPMVGGEPDGLAEHHVNELIDAALAAAEGKVN